MKIDANVIWKIVRMLYPTVIRPFLLAALDDPDSHWDEAFMKIADKVFCFKV